ncbi:MAG TPA: Holliday junction resolvase RuvX [Clostridiales bacterium]|nr:Holliday junction resolvase RuvX [Clostridiales bacterium]
MDSLGSGKSGAPAPAAAAGKWLGIDYGEARIGIAVSDTLGILARGLETIRWNGKDMAWALDRITALTWEHGITGLVIGIPRRTDGKPGKPGQSEDKARLMAALLAEKTGIEPILRDERYTTVLAHRIMRETGVRTHQRRAVVDQIAAEILLQEYLDSLRRDNRRDNA